MGCAYFIVGMRIMGEMGLIRAMSHINLISPIAPVLPINFISLIFPISRILNYSCPDSTISTTRSVSRSVFSGSYFFVRLAPKAQAKA